MTVFQGEIMIILNVWISFTSWFQTCWNIKSPCEKWGIDSCHCFPEVSSSLVVSWVKMLFWRQKGRRTVTACWLGFVLVLMTCGVPMTWAWLSQLGKGSGIRWMWKRIESANKPWKFPGLPSQSLDKCLFLEVVVEFTKPNIHQGLCPRLYCLVHCIYLGLHNIWKKAVCMDSSFWRLGSPRAW